MTLWTLARARRWASAMLVVLAGVAIGWASGRLSFELPSADGPRVVRQYLVAGLPCLLAPVLLDRLRPVALTLAREPALRCADQLLVVGGMALVLAPTWAWSELTGESIAYEAFVASVLLTVVLAGTPRWGLGAVLGAALVGLFWLLSGDTIARAMGFGELEKTLPGMARGLKPSALALVGLAALALPASFALGLQSRWRHA